MIISQQNKDQIRQIVILLFTDKLFWHSLGIVCVIYNTLGFTIYNFYMKNDKSVYRYYHGLYLWLSFLFQSTFGPKPLPLFVPLMKTQ